MGKPEHSDVKRTSLKLGRGHKEHREGKDLWGGGFKDMWRVCLEILRL